MEFIEMARERIANLERERKQSQQLSEARRLGAVNHAGLRTRLDGWLIRASDGARQRQERRASGCTQHNQVTS